MKVQATVTDIFEYQSRTADGVMSASAY